METSPLAGRLEQLRGDLSYREFAERCGMSESGVRKYFPPFTSVPSLDKAAAIAAAHGVSLEWLATGKTAAGCDDLAESARRLVLVADDQWCLNDQIRDDIRKVARAILTEQ
ncbi:helix-turn-helix domain-containing protein [Aeromonas sp. R7-3]|uniref:helix-turn-helix domain-containing protein n=1 Tax=Aeromonas sp. R7-3 TaxID=3138475 RepID=UPI0034A426F9